MVIGSCGFGYTGSGAVHDLLKEYTGVRIGPKVEFSFLYRPDGLTDLAYHLENPCRFFSSDIAVQRYRKKIHSFFRIKPELWGLNSFQPIYELTDSYLNSLSDVVWKGWWTHDTTEFSKLSFLIYRILDKLTSQYPRLNIKMQEKFYYRDMHLSVKPNDFIEKTQKYLIELFSILGYDIENEIILLDQAFAADNPTRSSVFFNSSKIIVVDKDPRDLYLICKKESFKDCAWIPTKSVDDFIVYYERIRRGYEDVDTQKCIIIRMEDLIYEYDRTVDSVEKYLGFSKEQHTMHRKYFDPAKSINNTQLFRKYPQYSSDIEIIEKELYRYLYPFELYPKIKEFGKTF